MKYDFVICFYIFKYLNCFGGGGMYSFFLNENYKRKTYKKKSQIKIYRMYEDNF